MKPRNASRGAALTAALLLAGCLSPSAERAARTPYLDADPQLESPAARQGLLPSFGSAEGAEEGGSPRPEGAPTADQAYSGYYSTARLAEKRGQLDEATKIYQELARQRPSDAAIPHRLAVVAGRQGRITDAERHFYAARQRAPASVELLRDMGYFYYLQGRLDEAERVLAEALSREPQNAGVCNNLGLVLGVQGRADDALNLFKRVNEPAAAEANLAYALSLRGELNRSENHYRRALDKDPELKSAANGLAHVSRINESRPKLLAGETLSPPQNGEPGRGEALVAVYDGRRIKPPREERIPTPDYPRTRPGEATAIPSTQEAAGLAGSRVSYQQESAPGQNPQTMWPGRAPLPTWTGPPQTRQPSANSAPLPAAPNWTPNYSPTNWQQTTDAAIGRQTTDQFYSTARPTWSSETPPPAQSQPPESGSFHR